MSFLLVSQYVDRIHAPSKAGKCVAMSRKIIVLGLCCAYLFTVVFSTVALHFLSRQKTYLESVDSSICRSTHNNDGIPLPLPFSLHYSLDNFNNAFNSFYSSFQCLNGNPSDLNTEDSWYGRLCLFHNVCLGKDGSSSDYLIDYFYPSTMGALKFTTIRNINSILLSLRHVGQSHAIDNLSVGRIKLIPVNHLDIFDTNRNVTYLHGTHLIYQIVAHTDMNFGHFIFDDVLGLYSNLKQFSSTRFNSPDRNYVLTPTPCSSFAEPLRRLCDKFAQDIFPSVTSHPVRSVHSLLNSSNRICFRQLLAGQGIAGSVGHLPANNHRARLLDEFRTDVLKMHGIDPNFTPRQHHIVLIQKTGKRKFRNLDEISKKIQATPRYAGINVTILSNFINLTVAEQLRLCQTMTIVISPCGGMSMLFSFLPKKATLIVSGYPQTEKIGYSAARMEAVYWDYQSHLHVLHYPVHSVGDFELAAHLKKKDHLHVKHYAEVILKPEKLFPLIDRAIIRASLNS